MKSLLLQLQNSILNSLNPSVIGRLERMKLAVICTCACYLSLKITFENHWSNGFQTHTQHYPFRSKYFNSFVSRQNDQGIWLMAWTLVFTVAQRPNRELLDFVFWRQFEFANRETEQREQRTYSYINARHWDSVVLCCK